MKRLGVIVLCCTGSLLSGCASDIYVKSGGRPIRSYYIDTSFKIKRRPLPVVYAHPPKDRRHTHAGRSQPADQHASGGWVGPPQIKKTIRQPQPSRYRTVPQEVAQTARSKRPTAASPSVVQAEEDFSRVYYDRLLDAFYSGNLREVVRLANAMQKWRNSPHLASGDYLAGWAVLFAYRSALSDTKNRELFVDKITTAEKFFHRAIRNDRTEKWRASSLKAISLIDQGRKSPEAFSLYLNSKYLLMIKFYQPQKGNGNALEKAMDLYTRLETRYPEWIKMFPFIEKEKDDLLIASALETRRRAEADSIFGRIPREGTAKGSTEHVEE